MIKIKTQIEKFKAKTKHYAPPVAIGATLGAAVGATLVFRHYNPKDMVAIQFPKGVLEQLKAGKGLAMNSNEGWFKITHHSEHPFKK